MASAASECRSPGHRIGVRYGEYSLLYDILVDSGADINVFNEELAEALGIDLTSGAFGLVGQRGFFDQFKVTFNFCKEELELIGRRLSDPHNAQA